MLTVDNKVKMLGSLKFGQPHSFTYTLTNDHTQEVHINKIVLGCASCTKASVDKWTVQPGETSILSVVFTPGSLGLQTKTIQILYSIAGSEFPSVELKFKATSHD